MAYDDATDSFYSDGYYSGIDDTSNTSTDAANPTPTNLATPAASSQFSLSDFLGSNLIGAASQAYGQTLQANQSTNVNDARIASAQATAQIQGQLLAAQQASLSASQAQTEQYFIYALVALGFLLVWKRFSK